MCWLPSFRGIYVWCITTIFRQPTFLDGIPADALAPYANITKLHQKFSCTRLLHLDFASIDCSGDGVYAGAAAKSLPWRWISNVPAVKAHYEKAEGRSLACRPISGEKERSVDVCVALLLSGDSMKPL